MKKNGLIGSVLDVEDILDLPYASFEETAQSILEAAVKIISADRGILLLVGERDDELETLASYGVDEESETKAVQKIAGGLLDTQDEVLWSEGEDSPAPPDGRSSYICIRLKKKTKVRATNQTEKRKYAFRELTKIIGAIYIDRGDGQDPFTEQDLMVIQSYLPYATSQLLHAKIYEMATLDGDTQFFTRSQLEHLLRAEIRLSEKFSSPLSMVMLDIDNLKGINQTYGEDVGDSVIVELAELIHKNIRKEDTCIRYGGDDFVLLLPCTPERGAKIFCRKLLDKFSKHRFLQGHLEISISMGIVVYPFHGDTVDKVIKRMDQALGAAKNNNQKVVIWSEKIDPSHHSDRLLGIITGDPAKDYRNVMMLLDTIVAVNSTLDYNHLMSIVVDMMIEMTGSDRCILITYDNKGEIQQLLAQDAMGSPIEAENYMEILLDKVRRTGMPISEQDMENESREIIDRMEELGLATVMCVPLSVRDKVIGVVYVDSKSPSKEFRDQDKIFFYALSREIGIAVENARLYEENLQQKKKVEELNEKLKEKVRRQADELVEVKETLDHNLKELKRKYDYSNIVGTSKAIQDIFHMLDRITESDVPVLIIGESGTGKELVSKAIHFNGPRKEKRFVTLNCAALSDSLLGSELFGYVKGAFTGADTDRKGLFEQAHNGTLFLDEVGDMSLKMQKELLRVLQEGEVRPVGGKDIIKVNTRIICATHRDLRKMIEEGKFREDLYYRINVVQLRLPPLRERKEDILPLAERFLQAFSDDQKMPLKKFTPEAVGELLRHDWPGNIRELKNVVERTALISMGEIIAPGDIVLDQDRTVTKSSNYSGLFELDYQDAKEEFIKEYLKHALDRNDGNVTHAAKQVGILRSSLHKMINKYDIEKG